MLRSILSLRNFTMRASDGEIGKVKDFYFDDHTWTLKYLVVETGNWLMGKRVLISTSVLRSPIWDSRTFPVDLTIDQVRHSPDIDTEKPVTRQHEADLYNYYSWPWDGGGLGFMTSGMVGGVIAPDVPLNERVDKAMHHQEPTVNRDKHLRSFKQLYDFELRTSEKNVGEVHDFLINDADWTIPFVVIETGSWYSGKKILTSTKFVDNIEWASSSVYLLQAESVIKHMPEFDYDNINDRDYMRRFETSYTNNINL